MPAKRRSIFFFSIPFAALLALAACGGGSTGYTSSTTTTSTTTAKITGTAKTTATAKPGQTGGGQHYAAMASATVTLWKISPDGTATQIDIGTVTTDSTGAFTIPSVAIPATGTGATSDYYYEVRITDGTNTVKYPLAPKADMTIAATPDTTLAATMLTDVVNNPNLTSNPTPTAETINQSATLVSSNVTALTGKTTLPGASDTAAKVLAAANGVASAGGNAEADYKALQFGSEYAGFKADLANASSASVAGYLMRISKESCGTANDPASLLDAQALAEALKAGTQYTASDVLAAYNAIANPQAASTRITDYGTAISGFDGSTAITDMQLIPFLSRRSLTTADSATKLDPDQALSLLLYLSSASGNLCTTNSLDFSRMVASLTGSSLMTAPKIMNYEIYNDMTGACTDPQVHFAADDVQVFIPKTSPITGVTGVTVSATGFNTGAPLALALSNDRWRSDNTAPCVTKDTSMTYTITATLSDASTVTATVTRQHNKVPEPTVFTINGTQLTNVDTSPVISTDTRPLFTWTPPAGLQATMTGAGAPPSGAQVKYTYEFAHYRVGSVGPINPPTAACPGANTGGARKLYSVSNFIPAADCNPTACLAAQITAGATGFTSSSVVECRMYINAWLVDQYDTLLGQAAGSFGFFKP